MLTIMRAQWLQLIRNPIAVLIMTGLSILMTLFIGGQTFDRIVVSVLPHQSMSTAEVDGWLEQLNSSDRYTFRIAAEDSTIERLQSSDTGLAIRLDPADFTVLAAAGDTEADQLAAFVGAQYRQELALREAAEDTEVLREQVAERLQTPALVVRAAEAGTEAAFAYDVRVHTLIGMGLFFATFTIMFSVSNLLEDRRLGVWDRVIQSATPRSAMYAGHLVFSFLLGLAQILIVFLLFNQVFGIDLGQNWPGVLVTISLFTLATVALGLFLAGLVSNVQQLNVIIPIVAVSSAMLGGAYWPIEIVSNQVLLTLSRFVPIRHALDALKGIVYYDYGWAQLASPAGVLALFITVLMGLGLMLVDRRR